MATVQQKGEDEVSEFFNKENIEFNSQNIKKICSLHMLDTPEKLYCAVARKDIVLGENDKNCILEKPVTQGWKKYIPFGLGIGKSSKAYAYVCHREEYDFRYGGGVPMWLGRTY